MTPYFSSLCLALTALLISSCSQTTPESGECKSIEILVGFGIGGGTDSFARNLSIGLSDGLDKPVQVVNITGGSGLTAYRTLLKRPADGCTLLALTTDYIVLAVFQPDDVDFNNLDLLARAHTELGLLSTYREGPNDWQSLVDELREEDRPLLVGGVGARSFDRVAVDVTLENAGIPYRYIPYNGAKEMQADLLGERLDVVYDEFGVMKSMYAAREAKGLILFNDRKFSIIDRAEPANLAGLTVAPSIWRGIAVHADTDQAQKDNLEQAVLSAMLGETYKKFEAARSLDLLEGRLGAEEFEKAVAQELVTYQSVVKN
ncbi:MAG: tripartite tricarboxylate transporter substrate-binding protein [Pseudomonadota bacterium]